MRAEHARARRQRHVHTVAISWRTTAQARPYHHPSARPQSLSRYMWSVCTRTGSAHPTLAAHQVPVPSSHVHDSAVPPRVQSAARRPWRVGPHVHGHASAFAHDRRSRERHPPSRRSGYHTLRFAPQPTAQRCLSGSAAARRALDHPRGPYSLSLSEEQSSRRPSHWPPRASKWSRRPRQIHAACVAVIRRPPPCAARRAAADGGSAVSAPARVLPPLFPPTVRLTRLFASGHSGLLENDCQALPCIPAACVLTRS